MTKDEIDSAKPTAAANSFSPAIAESDTTPFIVNGQYIKELSFEVPNAPQIFRNLSKATPDIKVNVDVHAKNIVEKS